MSLKKGLRFLFLDLQKSLLLVPTINTNTLLQFARLTVRKDRRSSIKLRLKTTSKRYPFHTISPSRFYTTTVETFHMDESIENAPKVETQTESHLPPPLTLILYGIPNRFKAKHVANILKEQGIEYTKLDRPYRQSVAKIRFATVEEREAASIKLDGIEVEGSTWNVKKAHDLNRIKNFEALTNKRRKTGETEETEEKRSILDQIIPWHNMPYEEQLNSKQSSMRSILYKITNIVRKHSQTNQPEWIKSIGKSPCCPLEPIIPSPRETGYRNKTEFTIGNDENDSMNIGFLLGATREGIITVSNPSECFNIPQQHQDIRNLFQGFIHKLPFTSYNKISHKGLWRMLMVRTTENRDAMALLQVNPQEFTSTYSVDNLKSDLLAYLKENENNELYNLKSLYIQEYDGLSNAAPNDCLKHLILGESVIYEEVMNTKFSISPSSFFQVNTAATEKLYGLVKEWSDEGNKRTTILDICCGTGTIGLCLANNMPHVEQIIGVDIVEEAIIDAKNNAALNNIDRIHYEAGKAEDLMEKILENHVQGKDADMEYIAILDPPRSGCHTKVLKAIRQCPLIKKVVYVSCNQKSLVNDASPLTRGTSNSVSTAPFRPVKARAVDLFPHTPHCELVMLFEREEPTSQEVKPETNVNTSTDESIKTTEN